MKVSQLILFVKDLERMTAYYRDVLGLVPGPQASESWVPLDAGGCRIVLQPISPQIAKDIVIADPPVPREGAAVKMTFHEDDVDAARRHLEGLGAVVRPLRRFGEVVVFDAVDPEGNILQVSNR